MYMVVFKCILKNRKESVSGVGEERVLQAEQTISSYIGSLKQCFGKQDFIFHEYF